MSAQDLLAALPYLILALASLASLLSSAFARRGYGASFLCTLVGLLLALVSLPLARAYQPRSLYGLLELDSLASYASFILIAGSLVVALLAHSLERREAQERGEFFALLGFAALGACLLAASSNLATLFVSLELLSTSLFGLIGYRRGHPKGARAAFMYLVLAGLSSAFLLLGMAFVYFGTGQMDIEAIARGAAQGGPIALAGLALMTVGIAFKLSLAPFHLWTPDVYDGASAPVSAFIASVSKGAMAFFLLRLFTPTEGLGSVPGLAWTFAGLSGLSMLAGNFLALRETRLKRILGFSSIAHLGYLLVAIVAGGAAAPRVAAFYVTVYAVSTLGVFSGLCALSSSSGEPETIEELRGLSSRRPWVALGIAASLLSLAGLPLTAGFIGKFLLFTSGLQSALLVLALLLAANSALSLFYYLRIISTMFRPELREAESFVEGPVAGEAGVGVAAVAGHRSPALALLALGLMTLVLFAMGVFPQPFLFILRSLGAGS
jgi:NADH-quinone oxidoreductase subunit N